MGLLALLVVSLLRCFVVSLLRSFVPSFLRLLRLTDKDTVRAVKSTEMANSDVVTEDAVFSAYEAARKKLKVNADGINRTSSTDPTVSRVCRRRCHKAT